MSHISEQAVRDALRGVMDPELGMSVVDLNMVREINITNGQVEVQLVLTVPGCPLAFWIVEQARQAVSAVPGVEEAHVVLLDEPWQPPEWTST